MKLFDEKFLQKKSQYVLQTVMTILVMIVVLALLRSLANSAIIASLGATTFIAFGMPHAKSAKPRYLLGGYTVGIVVGTTLKLLAMTPFIKSIPAEYKIEDVFFAALAVGLSMFLMVITNFEHPPACGLALGILLNDFSFWVLFVVIVGVTMITTIKTILKPRLRNLL